MKKRLILIGILLLVLPIMNIKAACSDSEVVALSKLAGNVMFTPVFKEETGNFDILVSNMTPDFYFRDITNGRDYKYTGGELRIDGYISNKSYRFKFYSLKPACNGDNILSKYVTLPGYNPYYKDPICAGLESYKFCQKWVNYIYNREKFVEMVNKYKQTNNSEPGQSKKEILGIYDYLILFYEKNYFILLPLIIITCLFVIVKQSKKGDLF